MNTIKPVWSNQIGYCLRLANGQGWHLIATEGLEPWIEKLASIMELKPWDGNGYPKLVFTRGETDNKSWQKPTYCLSPKTRENIPMSGREARESPTIQIWSHIGTQDVFCQIRHDEGYERDIARMLLALYPIFERAQKSGALPLHAALLELNGIAVLLAAPGSTGKSTCCSRLRSPWQPLCDDETLIVRDPEKRYLAHPFPTWSDYLMKRSTKTWNIEYNLPLSAIFFMEQAETDEVLPVGQGEAAAYIHHSAMAVYRRRLYHLDRRESKSLRLKLFDNACELSKAIPAFKLGVSLKGRFWEKIEAVLP